MGGGCGFGGAGAERVAEHGPSRGGVEVGVGPTRGTAGEEAHCAGDFATHCVGCESVVFRFFIRRGRGGFSGGGDEGKQVSSSIRDGFFDALRGPDPSEFDKLLQS